MLTIVALAAYKAMYDYPATAKFLSNEEKREIVLRLEHDRSGLSDVFDLKFMKHAFKDWKIWVHMFITIGRQRDSLLGDNLWETDKSHRHLHPPVLHQHLPSYYRQRNGLHERGSSAHDCATVCCWMHCLHLMRLLRRQAAKAR